MRIEQSQQPEYAQTTSITRKTLRNISLNLFVTAALAIVSFFKHQIYEIPYFKLKMGIYIVYLMFILSVWFLKAKGGKNTLLDLLSYATLNITLTISILYQCGRMAQYKYSGLVINAASSFFWSAFGLFLYVKISKCSFVHNVDRIGGIISSSTLVIFSINLLSYFFENFQPLSMALSLALSILFSLSLMTIINTMIATYSEHELASSMRTAALYYWHLPSLILSQMKILYTKIVKYEYL